MAKFGNPETQVAFSVFENKGVFALLLGSGLSRAAEIPTGWEITTDLVRRVAKAEGVEDQADWAQWYWDKYGKEPDYSELLGELASTPAGRRSILHSYIEPNDEDREEGRKLPTAGHKAIAQLVRDGFIRVIVTTNFDRLMENALREVGVEPTVVGSVDALKGAEPLAHTACYILKLHGDYKDERILNTAEELHGYPAEYDALLDRILDEYGLIVCGWSGEWDNALRASILRAPNRRYPMFWASRGELRGRGKELCDHRKGIQVPITDADKFFAGLLEQVQTLEQSRKQNPASVDLLVSRAKRYLSKAEYRIQLNDLLADEVERTLGHTTTDAGGLGGELDAEGFLRLVKVYEGASEGLVKVAGLIGRWGDGEAIKSATDGVRTLFESPEPNVSGNTVKIALRTYPASLVFEGLCLGLVRSERWSELRQLFGATVNVRFREPEVMRDTLLPICWDGGRNEGWKVFPGYERRHTPLSDHLFEHVFSAWARPFFGSMQGFEASFELLDVLAAVDSISGHDKEDLRRALNDGTRPQDFVWVHLGRDGWNSSVRERLIKQIDSPDMKKALLKAGFAKGDSEFLDLALENYRRCARRMSRW